MANVRRIHRGPKYDTISPSITQVEGPMVQSELVFYRVDPGQAGLVDQQSFSRETHLGFAPVYGGGRASGQLMQNEHETGVSHCHG
jgi:hypothetical protein